MFKQNDEELILGYLLEALDECESHEITDRLHKDEDFRRKYDKLTAAYLPAMAARDEEWETLEPPRGLTGRTIDFILKNAPRASKTTEYEQHVPASASLTQVHQAVGVSSFRNGGSEPQNTSYSSGGFEPEPQAQPAPETDLSPQMSETVTGQLHETRVSHKDALSPASLMPERETAEKSEPAARPVMSEQPEGTRRSRFRFWDMGVAACILGVVGLMLIQAVMLTREQTRIEGCRENMMLLGRALQQYSALHGGFFPGVHHVANQDHQMAGIYGPLLLEKEFISPECLFCPSASHGNLPVAVPRYSQLLSAGGAAASEPGYIRRLGGDYAYNIGFTENGEYRPVKNLERANYVLLADAPLKTPACRNACDVDLGQRETMVHGKHGMNVLYEDGHVALLSRPEVLRPDGSLDLLFRNDRGEMAPGIGPEDIVLGASELRVSVMRK